MNKFLNSRQFRNTGLDSGIIKKKETFTNSKLLVACKTDRLAKRSTLACENYYYEENQVFSKYCCKIYKTILY